MDWFRKPSYLLPIIFLVGFAAWRYGDQVWKGHPGDIYHRWVGSRELLLNGRNPYGDEVTEEIQVGLNGHKYDPRRDGAEQRFYYPVYVAFLMAPTVRLPFPVVKKFFAIFLLVLTAVSVRLWLDFLQWRITPMQQFLVVVLTLASMPALQGIYLENLGLMVSALIAGACFAVRRGWLILAGALLAFSTIKPHLVLPLVGCLFIWSTGAWSERRKLVWSFLLSMAVLIAAGELILPGWVTECVRGIMAYPEKSYGVTPLQLVFTRPLGLLLALPVMASTVYLAWRLRRAPTCSAEFCLVVASVLAATLVVIPSVAPYSDLQLLPGVLLLLKQRKEIWKLGRWARRTLMAALGLVAWPYVAIVSLAAIRFALPSLASRLWIAPLVVMPIFPLFVAAGLAWVVLQLRRDNLVIASAAG
jgi:Glycosyltransferase family 87